MILRRRALLWMPVATAVAGCATLAGRDPVQVQVVGIEPLPGEGMELRFLCKLRVQNPNDTPIEFNGIYVDLELRGSPFATGVSDAAGTIPRYGEQVVSLPVTVSALSLARQAIGVYTSSDGTRVDYRLKGKIAGSAFSAMRFESKGELSFTAAPARP